ncbi:MAG: anti-anti-sigma factor [Nitrosospira multiformis]|nr:anti-anti-sigma factor [Nitrosospira multiformis]
MNTIEGAAAIGGLIKEHESAILEDWIRNLKSEISRSDIHDDEKLRKHCTQFLSAFTDALSSDQTNDITNGSWEETRAVLSEISEARARQGYPPKATATFIFSLKQSLFARLQAEFRQKPEVLAATTWNLSVLLDKLGLFIIEIYQQKRDLVISRQQQELLELSTPVVKLWKNILALPLIGTLDSERTQIVMESLLQKIVETGAAIAIIDITGVPTVDTLVAQHLLKTIAAARLMGADCIISGIRPQIAQTIVHLGVNLEDVTTKATLADAFLIALERTGASIVRQGEG